MKGRLIPVVAGLMLLPATREPGAAMDKPAMIIDFTDTDRSEWYPVNDSVMGGVSQSGIRATDRETGLFSGVLSLENNGGFASVRAAVGPHDLTGHNGLEVRVRGDGRTYQLRLRTDDQFDGVAYRAYLETAPDEWTTTRIPFASFLPTFRGRTLYDMPSLDVSRIQQVAFMVADRNPGEFSLEIDFVRTW